MKMADEWSAFLFRIREVPSFIHGPQTGYPGRRIRDFPHSIQVNSGIIFSSRS